MRALMTMAAGSPGVYHRVLSAVERLQPRQKRPGNSPTEQDTSCLIIYYQRAQLCLSSTLRDLKALEAVKRL